MVSSRRTTTCDTCPSQRAHRASIEPSFRSGAFSFRHRGGLRSQLLGPEREIRTMRMAKLAVKAKVANLGLVSAPCRPVANRSPSCWRSHGYRRSASVVRRNRRPQNSSGLRGSEGEAAAICAVLWDATKSRLESQQWTHHPGSNRSVLYAEAPNGRRLSWIWLSPQRGSLRVRLNFVDPVAHRMGWDRLRNFQPIPGLRTAATEQTLRRTTGIELAVEFQTRLEDLFGEVEGARRAGDRLATFVLSIVDAAEWT